MYEWKNIDQFSYKTSKPQFTFPYYIKFRQNCLENKYDRNHLKIALSL